MKKTILAVCLAVFGAVGAFSQTASDTAKVPVKVNVAATVSIQPPEGSDGKGAEKTIAANTTDTLILILRQPIAVRYAPRGRAGFPSVISNSAGKITLGLPAQSYENADISLYTVSGKRVLRGRASASGGAFSLSRPNIAKGVYLLSVKGVGGSAFSVRHTHGGGRLSISAVFGNEGASAANQLKKGLADGDWTITASAAGYNTVSKTFVPVSGVNPLQNLTLSASGGGDDGPGPWDPVWACPSGISAGGLDITKDNLGLTSDYVIIKFNNGSAPTVTYPAEAYGTAHTVLGEHVKLAVSFYYENNPDVPYNIIVTGTAANGSLYVNGGGKKTLYMNGANITNPTGPAINIQSNKRTDVHLVGSCDKRNILKGAGKEVPEGEEQAKGAVFAEGSLVFAGKGTLEIRSTDRHAIVSDEFIEMEDGSIIIYESKGDGIHANERIAIKGGTLQIKCEGDAIQNERKTAGKDKTPCPITISGGEVTIRTTGTKGHGIVSDSGDVVISGGSTTKINITLTGNGSKGIRSHGNVTINGADTYLEAHGSRESLTDDTSSAAGIKADGNIEIKLGKLTIKSTKSGENGKGLNVDGDLRVSGGSTDIAADGDAVKVRGAVTVSGGIIKARSANKSDVDCGGKITVSNGTLDAPNRKEGN